jgi:hypothetical protein
MGRDIIDPTTGPMATGKKEARSIGPFLLEAQAGAAAQQRPRLTRQLLDKRRRHEVGGRDLKRLLK